MRAVKSVSIDSERRVIITYLDGSTETLYPNCIWCDSEALRQLIKDLLEEKADAITQTIENVTIASFADGADEGLIKKLLVSIDPIQEGEGDPSPDNVRPISGRTGLTVFHSGADTSNPATISVNWQTEAGTVYGGSLNVVSGELTVDRMYKEMLGNIPWQRSTKYPGGFYVTTDVFTENGDSIKINTPFMCTHAKTARNLSEYVYGTCFMDGSVNIRIMSEESTLAQWASYLDTQKTEGTPVSCCFWLSDPYTIQLASKEVNTILGQNNIWSDSGNILELEYTADTKLYIGNQ